LGPRQEVDEKREHLLAYVRPGNNPISNPYGHPPEVIYEGWRSETLHESPAGVLDLESLVVGELAQWDNVILVADHLEKIYRTLDIQRPSGLTGQQLS
jgi:hypothetical protein